MPITYGLAGQNPKERSMRDHGRMALLILCAMCLMLFLLGVVVGFIWRIAGVAIALIAVPVGFAGIGLVMRRLDPIVDYRARQRVKWLRGGQAEALVSWILRDGLDDSWHLFDGVQLRLPIKSDHDHVLVSRRGVFHVQCKSDRGLFELANEQLIRNGERCDFAGTTYREAVQLKDWLIERVGEPVYVNAVLAVPFGWLRPEHLAVKSVAIVHADNIVGHLERQPNRLSAERVRQIAAALEQAIEKKVD